MSKFRVHETSPDFYEIRRDETGYLYWYTLAWRESGQHIIYNHASRRINEDGRLGKRLPAAVRALRDYEAAEVSS